MRPPFSKGTNRGTTHCLSWAEGSFKSGSNTTAISDAAEMEKNAGKSVEERCALFAAEFAVPVTPEAQYRLGKISGESRRAAGFRESRQMALPGRGAGASVRTVLPGCGRFESGGNGGNAAPEPGDAESSVCRFDLPGQDDASDQGAPDARADECPHAGHARDRCRNAGHGTW